MRLSHRRESAENKGNFLLCKSYVSIMQSRKNTLQFRRKCRKYIPLFRRHTGKDISAFASNILSLVVLSLPSTRSSLASQNPTTTGFQDSEKYLRYGFDRQGHSKNRLEGPRDTLSLLPANSIPNEICIKQLCCLGRLESLQLTPCISIHSVFIFSR